GGWEKHDKRQCHHHRKVKQSRRGGGGGKTLKGVEDAAVERHKRDQQQVRKSNTRKFGRKRKAPGIGSEARSQKIDYRRRKQERLCQQHDLTDQQQCENAVGEKSRARRTALLADTGVRRHESRIECP